MASAPAYESIAVRPLAGALGAEIRGVDLAHARDNATWSEIHRAFLEYQVVVFRDQELSLDDIMTVAQGFGEPTHYPFVAAIAGYPYIVEIRKEPHETVNFGGTWHSDTTYQPRPPAATLLYAKDVPDYGGDTLFANQYLAYETLSPGLKAMLAGLKGVNSAGLKRRGGRAAIQEGHASMPSTRVDKVEAFEGIHPIVRTHPETGRKSLYLNLDHTIRFADMTEAESEPLLEYLAAHAVTPELTCRVRWEKGSLTIWDNRCTLHCALNDYNGQRRVMQRITVGGEVPA